WSRRVRQAWERDSDLTSTTDVHLLVVTARTVTNAAKIQGLHGVVPGTATAYVLRSPTFAVETVERSAVAIGSGRAYERLTEQLASIEGEIDGLHNFELDPGFAGAG